MNTDNQIPVKTRHVYNFDELDRQPEGPCSATVTPRRLISGSKDLATSKATSTGAVITGERFHATLVWKPKGTGSKIHTHPNEQFNYVLQGTLIADIDGQVMLVPKGHVVHIPAGMPHSHVSTADDDVWFFAAKDTRYGITGPALDGKHDGPRYLPGFFQPGFGTPGSNQWEVGADGLPSAQTENRSGRKMRYVYSIHELDDEGAQENNSAKVVIPTDAVKYPGFGGSLSGQKVGIELMHLTRGKGWEERKQPYEQFVWVLRGTLNAHIDGQQVKIQERSVLHLPEDIVHSAMASTDKDVMLYLVTPASK